MILLLRLLHHLLLLLSLTLSLILGREPYDLKHYGLVDSQYFIYTDHRKHYEDTYNICIYLLWLYEFID